MPLQLPSDHIVVLDGEVHTVFVRSDDNVSITEVAWTLIPATAGVVVPAVSPVELRTFTYVDEEGQQVTDTGYYAVTQLQIYQPGTTSLKVDGRGGAPDSHVISVTSTAEMVLDNPNIFVDGRIHAHNPGLGQAVDPTKDDQTLDISLKVIGDVEGTMEGLPNVPVYIRFDPPVVQLYPNKNGVWEEPDSLPFDPGYKGRIVVTGADGGIRVRAGSRYPVLGKMFLVVGGEGYEKEFSIITFALPSGVYPAPEGVPIAINLDKQTSSVFPARIPQVVPLTEATYAMMWFQGKDGVEHFGPVTSSPGYLRMTGESFDFADVITDGTRKNALAYFIQKGLNGNQSVFHRFSAVGDLPDGPDQSVERTLPMPLLSEPLVNVPYAKAGLTLTVPGFTVDQVIPADTYILQAYVYLRGWDHQTRLPRPPATLTLRPLTISALPAEATQIALAYRDLSGWDRAPLDMGGISGDFRADYTITAVTGAGEDQQKRVFYSLLLGVDPIIPLETPPDPADVPLLNTQAALAGLWVTPSRQTLQGTPLPDDEEA